MEGNTWKQVERWDVGNKEKSAKYVSKIINGEFVLVLRPSISYVVSLLIFVFLLNRPSMPIMSYVLGHT